MLLALWSGFWNVSDWTGGPTPPPVVTSTPGAGSGQWWDRANSDYWEERERMLQRFAPKVEVRKAVEERFPEVIPIVAKRNDIAQRLPEMPNLQAISDLGEMIDALDLQIKNYSIKCEEEALLALLL